MTVRDLILKLEEQPYSTPVMVQYSTKGLSELTKVEAIPVTEKRSEFCPTCKHSHTTTKTVMMLVLS
jgi:hypothetical protein